MAAPAWAGRNAAMAGALHDATASSWHDGPAPRHSPRHDAAATRPSLVWRCSAAGRDYSATISAHVDIACFLLFWLQRRVAHSYARLTNVLTCA